MLARTDRDDEPAGAAGDLLVVDPSTEGPGLRSRVEGGVDAVVVGATIDGMVAAAYLGRAGLRTVLLEAGLPTITRREFTPGYSADDGDFFVRDLNPDVVNGLDLYRHGLCFAQRRFDTMYYFADQTAVRLSGDLHAAYESVAELDEDEADRFQVFVSEVLDAAHELRPFFAGEPAPKLSRRSARLVERYGSASLDYALAAEISDTRLRDLLTAEASFHSAVKPSDPHSFLSLLRRWSGEAAGLQGGCALASSGYSGLFSALRRAVQAAGVDIRAGAHVQSMAIEWDVAAGVVMKDGGQIRAPIVVNALNAETAFIGQVGPSLIDIEFQRAIRAPKPHFASAKVHFALTGAPRDDRTRQNLMRRLVYAPDQAQLRRAYRMAREGGVAPDHLLLELVFPSAFEPGWAPENGNLAAGWVYPVPYQARDDASLRKAVAKAALNTFGKIVPGVRERLEATDIQFAGDQGASAGLAAHGFGGRAAVLAEAQRTRAVRTASGLQGLFFCGPEAQIGQGSSGAAGRNAAVAALRYVRSGAVKT